MVRRGIARLHNPESQTMQSPNSLGRFLRCYQHPTRRHGIHQTWRRLERTLGTSSQPRDVPFAELVGAPKVLRHVLFAVGVSGLSYAIAAYLTNRDTDYWGKKLGPSPAWNWSQGSAPQTSSNEMKRAKAYSTQDRVKKGYERAKETTIGLPGWLRRTILNLYVGIGQAWLNIGDAGQTCVSIGAINAGVWCAWQSVQWKHIMDRYFLHNPLSGRSIGILLSIFSHKSILHLGFNMVALMGFGSSSIYFLEKAQSQSESRIQESTAQYHFLSFFISAGLFANIVSQIVSARWTFPRAVREFSTRQMSNASLKSQVQNATMHGTKPIPVPIRPSLGASGAVYATLAMTALSFPQTSVVLIFLPMFSIPIQYGFGGIVLLDIIGIARGWRAFDHWAHLGGAAFGALYWRYGPNLWDKTRNSLR